MSHSHAHAKRNCRYDYRETHKREKEGKTMFFVWLGILAFSICVLVGEYLLIRIAVRDGIDSSSTADWREMYVLEQE